MIDNTKLVKTCNTTRKIVKGLRIFLYAAMVLFVVSAVVMCLPAFAEQTESMMIDNTVTGTQMEYTRQEVITQGTWAMSAVAIGSVIMLLCEKILGTVNSESTPFVAENVKRLKAMSILMACLSVVPSWISQIVSIIMGSGSMMMNVELSMILIGLVIWCLAMIFEYGVSLQQREDETL